MNRTPKADISRRDFLRISGVATAGLLSSGGLALSAVPTADLVLRNGKILTVDAKDSVCQAVAVRGEKILAVGSEAEVSRYVGATTKVMDLKGKMVTPGLVDAHAHLPYFGLRENGWFLKLQGMSTKEDVLEALAQRARNTPKGEWISAWGVESLSLSFLTKEELDRVSRDHPMLVVFTGGQWGFANSRALRAARIDAATPNPPGGKIGRTSPGGEPSGLLIHYPALHLVRRHMPVPDEGQAQAALLFAAEMYAADGVTAVHDNFVSPIQPNFHKGYFELVSSGRLPVRIKLWPYMPNPRVSYSVYRFLFESNAPLPPANEIRELVRCKHESPALFASLWGGFKMAVDGGGPSSMWYRKPGLSLHTRNEFNEMVGFFHRKGQQISVHAVGDEAVDWVLDAIERAQREHGRSNHRHRIEHALSPLSTSLHRMRDLGAVVCTHPQWMYGWGDKWSGLKRLAGSGRGVMPLASYARKGIPLAMGADPPAFPIHRPQVALSTACTRTTRKGHTFGAAERISVKQAVRIQTMGSAFSGFQEKEIGSIEKEKRADMVVWDQDLLASPPEAVRDTRAILTVMGGKVVHDRKSDRIMPKG